MFSKNNGDRRGDTKLASKGLDSLLDSLYRDPSVGTMVFLTVSKGKAEDILSHKYSNIENIGTFLYDNIRKNIKSGQIPSSTLHEFQRHSYNVGGDPILPIFERRENELDFSGIALFNRDKMVAEASPIGKEITKDIERVIKKI